MVTYGGPIVIGFKGKIEGSGDVTPTGDIIGPGRTHFVTSEEELDALVDWDCDLKQPSPREP